MEASVSRFSAFLAQARELPPLPVAVVDAGERHVLEGVLLAVKEGLIHPTLIGDPSDIREFYPLLPGLSALPILPGGPDPVSVAVDLYRSGKVASLIKGHVPTAELLHGFLSRTVPDKRLSHVFVAELATYPKLLFITDAAINIAPDLETKADIARNAIHLARCLGVEIPKVAVLSAIEFVNSAIPSTLDAACLAKMADRDQIRGAIVDGPLAFDSAISRESSEVKKIRSPVAGDADILLVPDLVSGNILAKDLEYLAGATLAGLVVGPDSLPIILNSRSDPPKARLASCAIAAIVFNRRPGASAPERNSG